MVLVPYDAAMPVSVLVPSGVHPVVAVSVMATVAVVGEGPTGEQQSGGEDCRRGQADKQTFPVHGDLPLSDDV